MLITKEKSTGGHHQAGPGIILPHTPECISFRVKAINLLVISAFLLQLQASSADTKMPFLFDSKF
jgi:hypothetical protein